jgi:hypothetical protein
LAERESDAPAEGISLEQFQRIQRDAEAGIVNPESSARIRRYLEAADLMEAGTLEADCPAILADRWKAAGASDDEISEWLNQLWPQAAR